MDGENKRGSLWIAVILLYVTIGAVAYVYYIDPILLDESKQCLHGPAAAVEVVGNETVVTYLSGNEQGFIGEYKITIDGEDYHYEKDDWEYLTEERFPWRAENCTVYAFDLAINQFRVIGKYPVDNEVN